MDFIAVLYNYGPGALALIIVIWFTISSSRRSKKVDEKLVQITVEISTLTKLREDVELLKEKDHEIELNVISLRASVENVEAMSTRMINYFVERGMKK
jgi:hypothetical protein